LGKSFGRQCVQVAEVAAAGAFQELLDEGTKQREAADRKAPGGT
jgi:hypothetical protein